MNNELKFVELFADGSCSGNPGPGGWGTILRFGKTEKELSGGAKETTNNRMEITAVLEGLRALKYPCRVKITTDSQYVYNSITKGWAEGWKKNNWVKKTKSRHSMPTFGTNYLMSFQSTRLSFNGLRDTTATAKTSAVTHSLSLRPKNTKQKFKELYR